MLFIYYKQTQCYKTFGSFEEMSEHIPLRYEVSPFEEKNMTLFEAKSHWRLGKVYDTFEQVFLLPNVILMPGAENGYMPGLHLDLKLVSTQQYCDEYTKRGNCYISQLIVSEKTGIVSGKFSYYAPDHTQDNHSNLWGTVMRLAIIDDMLNDLE